MSGRSRFYHFLVISRNGVETEGYKLEVGLELGYEKIW